MYTKDSCVSISFEKFLRFGKKTLSKDLEVTKNSCMLRSQLYSCMKRKDLQASSQYICILSTDAVISEVDTNFLGRESSISFPVPLIILESLASISIIGISISFLSSVLSSSKISSSEICLFDL
jgi:hypothetical protein